MTAVPNSWQGGSFGERAPADSTLVALTRVRDRLTPLQQDVIAFVEASRAELKLLRAESDARP